jgi:hypothetical protein
LYNLGILWYFLIPRSTWDKLFSHFKNIQLWFYIYYIDVYECNVKNLMKSKVRCVLKTTLWSCFDVVKAIFGQHCCFIGNQFLPQSSIKLSVQLCFVDLFVFIHKNPTNSNDPLVLSTTLSFFNVKTHFFRNNEANKQKFFCHATAFNLFLYMSLY